MGAQSISENKSKSGDADIELVVHAANSNTGTEPSAAAEVTRITSSLLKTNEQLASFLLSSKEDNWKEKEFQSLVRSYLESSRKTLDLCVSLGTCIERARQSLLTIRYAVKLFDREMEAESEKHFETNKWKRLLEDLKGFKTAGGDPFDAWSLRLISLVYEEEQKHIRLLEEFKGPAETSDVHFFEMFVLVNQEQKLLFEKLRRHEGKLSKNLIRIRKMRRFSNIVFGIGFFSVPVLTALLMIIPVPSAVEILIGAFSATIGSIGKWSSHIWSKRERDTEDQRDAIKQTAVATILLLNDLERLQAHVEKLEVQIGTMMHAAEFAMKVEGGVTVGMSEMRRLLKSSLLTIEEAASSTYSCTRGITNNESILSKKLAAHHESAGPESSNWLDIFM